MQWRCIGRWRLEFASIVALRRQRVKNEGCANISEWNDLHLLRFTSMDTPLLQVSLIADLEARQDDLMLRLDELDKRVERALAECQTNREPRSDCRIFSNSLAENTLRN